MCKTVPVRCRLSKLRTNQFNNLERKKGIKSQHDATISKDAGSAHPPKASKAPTSDFEGFVTKSKRWRSLLTDLCCR